MKASEHLAAARDEIQKGWTKGRLDDGCGNVCAVGALAKVAQQHQPATLDGFADLCANGAAAAEALKLMTAEFGDGERSIMGFNDSHTKQDVLNWFDKTIAGLEEHGE